MKILVYPNPVLRAPTKRICIFGDQLRATAQQMAKLMIRHKGIGLAAPQIGLSRRLILIWDGNPQHKILVMCNPELITSEGFQTGQEGCLSFPDQWFEVTRGLKITCRYQDMVGKLQKVELEGLLARCFQHELDHLDGVLFIDYKEEERNK